ncbi:MAG: hypothetical protein WCJ47_08780 [Methanomicrobiales archaeon]
MTAHLSRVGESLLGIIIGFVYGSARKFKPISNTAYAIRTKVFAI